MNTTLDLQSILSSHVQYLVGKANGIKADLRWADLREADLSKADLREADLRQADLSKANLRGANFTEADLSKANLRGANFTEADLREADLREADLRSVNLRGADLSKADLREADLRWADLREADLSKANLRGANFTEADLREADLREADLSWSNLREADLRDADLRDAVLTRADLSGATGLLDPSEWIKENLESCKEGVIAYKTFGKHFSPPNSWHQETGAVITEVVNPDRCTECGSGVNVGTLAYVKQNNQNKTIWKLLIEWEDLPGVVVPYNTDGKIRCSRATLIEKLS